jgi:hypothetical protein
MNIDTALSLVEEDYDENEWEGVEIGVDDGHHKHDATNYYSIFLRKSDNTHWKICFTTSYNYGFDASSVYFYEVTKKEVVKTIWVAKK